MPPAFALLAAPIAVASTPVVTAPTPNAEFVVIPFVLPAAGLEMVPAAKVAPVAPCAIAHSGVNNNATAKRQIVTKTKRLNT